MGEVVKFEDLDADLQKPKWFYRECERLAHLTYDRYRQHVETCPFGAMTIDHLFEALSQTPERLMALKEGDDELEDFIIDAAMFGCTVRMMAEGK